MSSIRDWWNSLTSDVRDEYEQLAIDEEDGTGRPPDPADVRAGRVPDPRPEGKYLSSADVSPDSSAAQASGLSEAANMSDYRGNYQSHDVDRLEHDGPAAEPEQGWSAPEQARWLGPMPAVAERAHQDLAERGEGQAHTHSAIVDRSLTAPDAAADDSGQPTAAEWMRDHPNGDPDDRFASDDWHPRDEYAFAAEETADREDRWESLTDDEQAARAAAFAGRYEDDTARYAAMAVDRARAAVDRAVAADNPGRDERLGCGDWPDHYRRDDPATDVDDDAATA